jgi:phospholipid/cholesterol/gamma-HCH transport system ATP-binding protein
MSAKPQTAIVLDRVSKFFGEKHVLREASLEIKHGEAVCILGRSGTGKSVTLKLIISLLKPDAGHIWIGDEDITRLEGEELSKVRRKMGFLFQNAALFDSVNLQDNLVLPLKRLTSKSRPEIQEIIDRVLGEVGLSADAGTMPVELSGGMRKRAGLARAMVLNPEILLVDEPSSGLDAITASEIDDLLLRQKVQQKTTMVIVTHDLRGARRLGDRFAVLDHGSFIAFGTPEELKNHDNEIVRRLMAEG